MSHKTDETQKLTKKKIINLEREPRDLAKKNMRSKERKRKNWRR